MTPPTHYHQSIERLRTIMNELRERCPWDKKQTIQTLRPQTLEELYELTEAIAEENWPTLLMWNTTRQIIECVTGKNLCKNW